MCGFPLAASIVMEAGGRWKPTTSQNIRGVAWRGVAWRGVA